MIKIDETKALLAKLDVSKATGLADVGPYFSKTISRIYSSMYNLLDKSKHCTRSFSIKLNNS
jgi:hypothetical protein